MINSLRPSDEAALTDRKYDDEKGEHGGFGSTQCKIEVKVKVNSEFAGNHAKVCTVWFRFSFTELKPTTPDTAAKRSVGVDTKNETASTPDKLPQNQRATGSNQPGSTSALQRVIDQNRSQASSLPLRSETQGSLPELEVIDDYTGRNLKGSPGRFRKASTIMEEDELQLEDAFLNST